MKRSSLRRVAVASLLALVLAACGTDDDTGSGDRSNDRSSSPPTSAVEIEDDHDDTAAIPDEVGPADESLDPIRVGMINMSEGTPSYPDVAVGADAAVSYANAKLGGIGGHPIELVHCNVGTDQASNQKCAQRFANDDDIGVVVHGYVFGAGYVLPILEAADVPVLLQTPLTQPDFEATNGFAYQGGNAGGTSGTAAYAAKFLDAENIVILGADNDALRAAVQTIEALPSMADVEVSTTYIPDTAADVTADVQASGAADADAILALINGPQCPQVAQTLRDLNIDAPVVSTTTCAVPATLETQPELFEGWTVVGSGLPPLLPEGASAELDFYREVFPDHGDEAKMDSFLSLGGFGAILALRDIGSGLPENPGRDDWRAGLEGFTGPYFGGRDELSCPGEHFPAVCDNDIRAFVLDGEGVMSQVQGFFDPLA